MKNKPLLFGILTTIASWCVIAAISYLWFGKDGLFENEENLFVFKYFIPVWAIMFGYCGWWITKRYLQKKKSILGDEYEMTENIGEWKKYLHFTIGKYLKMISRIVAITIPVFLIDYLGGSKFLGTSIGYLVFFIVVGIITFVIGKIMERKALGYS